MVPGSFAIDQQVLENGDTKAQQESSCSYFKRTENHDRIVGQEFGVHGFLVAGAVVVIGADSKSATNKQGEDYHMLEWDHSCW